MTLPAAYIEAISSIKFKRGWGKKTSNLLKAFFLFSNHIVDGLHDILESYTKMYIHEYALTHINWPKSTLQLI